MKIAVMQPYLFPYLGYFQLIQAVDTFVLYDDVHYINRAWINRNRILLNGAAFLFTVPLVAASQNKLILEIAVSYQPDWRPRFMKTLHAAYARAPFRVQTIALLEQWIAVQYANIADMNHAAIAAVCDYAGLSRRLVRSSSVHRNAHLKGQDRIIDICINEGASTYVNAIGGVDLYDDRAFDERGMQLRFLRSRLNPYSQRRNGFVPNLSMIDCLMFLSPVEIRARLEDFTLLGRDAVDSEPTMASSLPAQGPDA